MKERLDKVTPSLEMLENFHKIYPPFLYKRVKSLKI